MVSVAGLRVFKRVLGGEGADLMCHSVTLQSPVQDGAPHSPVCARDGVGDGGGGEGGEESDL